MERQRHIFRHNDRKIYEWEQSLEDVVIYIEPPQGVSAKDLLVSISPRHLVVGLKGAPPFINEELFSAVRQDSSLWTFGMYFLHSTRWSTSAVIRIFNYCF